jgi:hypothetical protein
MVLFLLDVIHKKVGPIQIEHRMEHRAESME